ncbi:MAG: bifunctional nuclease family protein [Phaeodactylibacter sp.]|nr:bifunctional nuclease family protein [Phaeodactylibacter sp.]
MAQSSKIELNIIALSESVSSPGHYTLILEEFQGFRRLPIIIGPFEAQAIAITLERMQPSRPMTHDLFRDFLLQLHVQLVEVQISDLKEGIFHAKILCRRPDGSDFELDARSSDALALAVRFDCPIFTFAHILDQAGIQLDSPSLAFTNKRGSLVDYSLEELEQLLEKVLQKEDYESATRIRDAIQKKKDLGST